jgi:ligand-binding SRPBCC domain-containing protein
VQTIRIETLIQAPVGRCFNLARSIDLHVKSAEGTEEKAIGGVMSGLIGLGESVTWEARHFGVRQRLTSKITMFEPPAFFQDRMLEGAFHLFEHDHRFEPAGPDSTCMVDVVRFAAPFGIFGRVVERMALRAYLTHFLRRRCKVIKEVAESPRWRDYLATEPSGGTSS